MKRSCTVVVQVAHILGATPFWIWLSKTRMKLLDYDFHPGSTCWNIDCAILPVGYGLIIADSIFDLNWVLRPSSATKQALIGYYTTILTPKVTFGYPGYWWPLFVIFKLCIQCPNELNYLTLMIFLPIAYRYVGLMNGTDTQLRHWWTIVVLRILLVVVNTWNLRVLQCYQGKPSLRAYVQHIQDAIWS